jgi:hypothetical protein
LVDLVVVVAEQFIVGQEHGENPCFRRVFRDSAKPEQTRELESKAKQAKKKKSLLFLSLHCFYPPLHTSATSIQTQPHTKMTERKDELPKSDGHFAVIGTKISGKDIKKTQLAEKWKSEPFV